MRHLFFIWLVALSVSMYAQQQKHTVMKGETLVTIAKKYGVTVDDLRQENPQLKTLYTGMSIKIPAKTQTVSSTIYTQTSKDVSESSTGEEICRPALAYIDFAKKYIEQGKHNKAIKELNKSLKEQENVTAHWLRGQCYFYEGKWKKALEDLVLVRSNPKMPLDIQEAATQMYADAEAYQEASSAETKQFWREALASVGLVALQAGQQAMYNQQMKSYQPTTGTSSNYNLDMQKIWRNAAIQTQQKTQQDFYNFQQMVYQNTGTLPTWEDYGKALAEVNNDPSTKERAASVEEFNAKLDADAAARTDKNYRQWYSEREKLVESHYLSLTNCGFRGTNSSGTIVGTETKMGEKQIGNQLQLKNLFIKSQRELKNLREEAARNGVIITPSKWETAVVYH